MGCALRSVEGSAAVAVDVRSWPGAWSTSFEGDRFTSLSTSLLQVSATNGAQHRRMKNLTPQGRLHSVTHSFGDVRLAVDHG